LKTYCLPPNYTCRTEEVYCDTFKVKFQYQWEVYKHAKALSEGLTSALDVGCGSRGNTLQYLGHLAFRGLDVPRTVERLRRERPSYRWDPFDPDILHRAELVVCADVLEHLLDPDIVLEYIARVEPKLIVLSTPNRDAGLNTNGPPHNPHHIREWAFSEFAEYVGQHFNIREHYCVDPNTQVIVCENRKTGGPPTPPPPPQVHQ
jgi:hypothetical protein